VQGSGSFAVKTIPVIDKFIPTILKA